MKYNPKDAYYARQNKTQRRNSSDRAKHRDSSSQGGCSCNYIINTDNKKVGKQMREFEDLPRELKQKIQEICDLDPYGLSPNTLYKNIYTSSGSYVKLAEIFEVMPSLVKAIKEN